MVCARLSRSAKWLLHHRDSAVLSISLTATVTWPLRLLPCILAIRNLICWCSSRSTAWAYPSQRTASPYRLGFTFCTEPAYSRRLLYSRSVPIFRTNLSRYARRITMAVAIAAPPLIWYIPTLSSLPSVSSQFSATRQGIYAVWSLHTNFSSSSVRWYIAQRLLKHPALHLVNSSYASSEDVSYIFKRFSTIAILFNILSFIIVCC